METKKRSSKKYAILVIILSILIAIPIYLFIDWMMNPKPKEEILPMEERWQIVDAYATKDNGDATTHITVKYLGENKALNVVISYAESYSKIDPDTAGWVYRVWGREMGDLSKGETFYTEMKGYTANMTILWDIRGYTETLDEQLITRLTVNWSG